jgi:hypothetical protein
LSKGLDTARLHTIPHDPLAKSRDSRTIPYAPCPKSHEFGTKLNDILFGKGGPQFGR